MTAQFDPILGQLRDGTVTVAEQLAGFNKGSAAEKAAFQTLVSGYDYPRVYVQPDMSGAWPGRPVGETINIPPWASFADVLLWSAGSSGGSGRVGAAGTARSGGQGGGGGGGSRLTIALRDQSGVLLSPTMTLTLGAPSAPGASITTPDTNGAVSALSVGSNSSLAFGGFTYTSRARDVGGTAAGSANLGFASLGFGDIPVAAGGSTNVTAAAGTAYVGSTGTHVSAGGGGGSLSAANAALAGGALIGHYLGSASTQSLSSGANGFFIVQGPSRILSVGGAGGSVGQAGGNGGPGSGGGGGGAAVNGSASGAGGWGGFGAAIIKFS